MPKRERFFYRYCPRCLQYGSLVVVRIKADGALAVRCDECEIVFDDPDEATDHRKGTECSGDGGDTFDYPSRAEVEAAGWTQYCKELMPEG